jgi:4-O-beta-D-mannosyl-D-glucose phosphorylase
VVLHPEFFNGQYAFYTRPQEGFIDTGKGGGIGWGLVQDIENAVIKEEIIVDEREYHTVKEMKNGLGPAPIKTKKGWLQLAHGVRTCAAGLRYVLYIFLTDLKKPFLKKACPGGYLMAPEGEERVGDVSNVLFSSAWVLRKDGEILIYYASSDTRCHVARTSVDRLLDFVFHTPEDPGKTFDCVQQRMNLIKKNMDIMKE